MRTLKSERIETNGAEDQQPHSDIAFTPSSGIYRKEQSPIQDSKVKRAKRLDIIDLETLLAVAETGSFRKACQVLGIGQPAVSRRIQRLEEALGVSLFERRPGGAQLTPTGLCLAERATAFLDDLDAAAEMAKSAGVAGNGRLRVGFIASMSRGPLRRIVQQFLAEHGDVDLYLVESARSELLMLLSHRRIDAVYAAGLPQCEMGDGLVVAHEAVFLAVAANSPFAQHESLAWDDVVGACFIVSTREPGPEIHDYIVRRISDLGRTASVCRHRLGREGIMSLVGLGVGISLVADHWRGVQYPNVRFVPIGDKTERVPFSLMWRPENDNPALRRFISLAHVEAKKVGANATA